MLAALWLAVRVLPALPDLAAAVLVLAFGALIAWPEAWAAAVRRGHQLRLWRGEGRLRGLIGGAGLRVLGAGILGCAAAGLLLVRLEAASPAFWALAVLALPLTWGLMAWLGPRLAREAEGLHARRLVHLWARIAGVAVLLAAAALLPAPVPAPLDGPPAAAPLVAEALTFARLWAGLEAFALGRAAEFGAWGRGLAALVSALGLAGVFWALATLAVAATLPLSAARRALAPASDAAAPPGLGRLGPAMAAGLALALLAGAGLASRWLAALPPAARPSAEVQVAAEYIGGTLHAAGTLERLTALRAAALAEDAAGREAVRAAMDAGFDAMAGNVDAFLDDYYTLTGEYGRLIRWAFGRLEDHMTHAMAEALQAGAPFARFEAEEAAFLAAARARAAALAEAEAALLAETRIQGLNPARLRIDARHGALPLPPAILAADLTRAQVRWGISAGAGVVAAAMAQRVVARLAARGLIGTAARMAVRAGGLLVAFGLDYALVKLDEFQNRDEFRAAILAEIEAQRALALAALEGGG